MRTVQAVLDHEAIANLTSSKPVGLKGNKSRGETPQGSLSRPDKKSVTALDDLLKKVTILSTFVHSYIFTLYTFSIIFSLQLSFYLSTLKTFDVDIETMYQIFQQVYRKFKNIYSYCLLGYTL